MFGFLLAAAVAASPAPPAKPVISTAPCQVAFEIARQTDGLDLGELVEKVVTKYATDQHMSPGATVVQRFVCQSYFQGQFDLAHALNPAA
jgi:hypothetical protein